MMTCEGWVMRGRAFCRWSAAEKCVRGVGLPLMVTSEGMGHDGRGFLETVSEL